MIEKRFHSLFRLSHAVGFDLRTILAYLLLILFSGCFSSISSPDNTFEILINNDSKKKGSLLEDFDPSVNPDKEIGKLAISRRIQEWKVSEI